LIRVSSLVIYPLKSCRGIEVDLATVGATGFEHDRRWMLVGEDGTFLSQREHHRLALVRVRLEEDRFVLDAPGLPSLEVTMERGVGPTSRVQVWDDECAAIAEGEDAARWFTKHLGCSARLVRIASDEARPLGSSMAQPGDHVSFADGFPFLLLSSASLDGLNHRLSLPVPMDRFRPNIVIDGCEPHAEDRWSRVRIGEVTFRFAKPCARCVVTTVDQNTGERRREPLRTLSTYRTVDGQVLFGQNLVHEGRGVVRVGDSVDVLEEVRNL
jgi:uncharacterized protein YcbX